MKFELHAYLSTSPVSQDHVTKSPSVQDSFHKYGSEGHYGDLGKEPSLRIVQQQVLQLMNYPIDEVLNSFVAARVSYYFFEIM